MDSSILELSGVLLECSNNKIFYLKTSPEILDITDRSLSFYLELHWSNKSFKININKNNYGLVYSLIKQSIFRNKQKIICYNFKNYCSAYKNWTKKDIEIEASIYDLKIISSFLGKKINNPPKNFKEAYFLLKEYLEGNWENVKSTYNNLYTPLITTVIPGLENKCLIDTKDKKIKKSYYEIESQENSRLSNFGYFNNSFLPMNLKKEDKDNLLPLSQEDIFLYFDYKNMEVSILESLTKDPELTRIINNYNDFYEGLYKELINPNNFDKDKRKKIKAIFLPYIYGASESLISNKNNISIETSKEIIKRIRQTFKKTFNWLEDYSNNSIGENLYQNKFGKIRKIEEKYKSINIVVQSNSSMFCLDKLIDIYNILEGRYISFYIHDGYGFIINKNSLKEQSYFIRNILLEENKNFKNMTINVSCSYGRNLNNMVEYNFEDQYEKNMQ